MVNAQQARSPSVLRKPFDMDHRSGRRRNRPNPWVRTERRLNGERRLDADWRFSEIRRRFKD